MGRLVVLMGATGAGKSVQAERLAADYGWAHLSSGDLLRRDPDLAPVLAAGQLVPAQATNRVVAEAISIVDEATPIILDGFPRDHDEARWLAAQLANWNRQLTQVLYVAVDRKTSYARLRVRARQDDVPAALEEKWHEFETVTLPVVEDYRRQGLVREVDGNGTLDQIYTQVRQALDL